MLGVRSVVGFARARIMAVSEVQASAVGVHTSARSHVHLRPRRASGHIGLPENASHRKQVMASDRLLNTDSLRAAAANLQMVTSITPSMLEALHRHELDKMYTWLDKHDKDVTHDWTRRHSAWWKKWTRGKCEQHVAMQRRAILDWAHVRRGSDLFVRGLGRFDISLAGLRSRADICTSVHELRRNHRIDRYRHVPVYQQWLPTTSCRLWWRSEFYKPWVLRPQDLQARGYFPEIYGLFGEAQEWEREYPWEYPLEMRPSWEHVYKSFQHVASILALPNDHPVRRHLIRFHSHWKRPEHANTLHELADAAAHLSLENVRQVGPSRSRLLREAGVLNMIALAKLDDGKQASIAQNSKGLRKAVLQGLVRNAAEKLPSCWPDALAASAKPITLLGRLRELEIARHAGPDVHFSHLNWLPDGHINELGEQMQVLRSKHAVIEVGRRLRNCAASYVRHIENGGYVLVSLVDTNTGLPKALGGSRSMHLRDVLEGDAWEEIVEHSNQEPSPATRCAFRTYYWSIVEPEKARHAGLPVYSEF
jgi:hypothetical protein